METKQNPFSLYDFLGYFTPGAIFLYGCLAVYGHLQGINVFSFITQTLSFDKGEIYVPFVLASYTVGHLLSYLSSIFVEKYSVWSIGYPSKYLMGYKTSGYFEVGKTHGYLRKIIRFTVSVLLLPITLLDVSVGYWAKYRDLYAQPLDPLLINIIRAKTVSLLEDHSGLTKPPAGYNIKKDDFFRFVYHYAVENAPSHLPKMQNYVAIYGFLRTLTLISVILFWGIFWHVINIHCTVTQGFIALLAMSLLSFILYMSFVKFYRRFSLEALMALTSVYKIENMHDPDNLMKRQ